MMELIISIILVLLLDIDLELTRIRKIREEQLNLDKQSYEKTKHWR